MNFAQASQEIQAGRAKPHSLWLILGDEHERDGYALKPALWEGSGEYQRVSHDDGRDVLVRIPFGRHLPSGATQ